MTPHIIRILALPLLTASLWANHSAVATELVYTPTNPTFGGNPANASGLLANANAQNNYKAPVVRATPKTALERFSAQLESAVLSRLSTSAVSELFPDGKLKPNSTVVAGNYVISITEENGNLVLTTTDKSIPGSSTRIVVGNTPTEDSLQ
jgi:curli production assembly/transport component CsgF